METDIDKRLAEEYHGEWKYVNTPPQRLHAMLETEKDPKEIEAIKLAILRWEFQKSRIRPVEAGEPYRGEKRENITAKSMTELAKAVRPVKYDFIQGKLKTQP